MYLKNEHVDYTKYTEFIKYIEYIRFTQNEMITVYISIYMFYTCIFDMFGIFIDGYGYVCEMRERKRSKRRENEIMTVGIFGVIYTKTY